MRSLEEERQKTNKYFTTVTVTSEVSAGQVVFTLKNIQIDTGLVQLSYHSNNNNFGGTLILNVAYTAKLIGDNSNNASGYSHSITGNVRDGILITIKENNIALGHSFRHKAVRCLSCYE